MLDIRFIRENPEIVKEFLWYVIVEQESQFYISSLFSCFYDFFVCTCAKGQINSINHNAFACAGFPCNYIKTFVKLKFQLINYNKIFYF